MNSAVATTVERCVVIVTAAGSFTAAGERLTGPVDGVDKLEKLIEWAHNRGLLQPQPIGGAAEVAEARPARVWVVGAGCGQLIGSRCKGDRGAVVEQVGQCLTPLVTRGWELRSGLDQSFVLARGRAPQRLSVEVVAEPGPWLAGNADAVAENAAEFGRRLLLWHSVVGILPASSGAASGAVLSDHIMRARAGRRGAVVTGPGLLPAGVMPDVRIQSRWCAPQTEVEQEFERSDELVWLAQVCPQLASAGMLTFGHGRPQVLDAAAAAAAAEAPKPPFGLWRATLPPASSLQLTEMLPAPHPQMRTDEPAHAWLTTEDLDGLGKDVRDGGAALTVGQLAIDEAIVWPQQGRILEAWATRLREAREALVDDPPLRALVESAATDYLNALADPYSWTDEAWRHHFQPAWAAAIAAHVRFRGRRAAMRISREYRLWPVYARDAAMIYMPGRDETTSAPIDLSDRHSRLGRMAITGRAAVSDKTILAVILAESTTEVAEALTAALGVPADHSDSDCAPPAQSGIPPPPQTADTGQTDDQTSID